MNAVNPRSKARALLSLVPLLAACSAQLPDEAAGPTAEQELRSIAQFPHARVCDAPTRPGMVACHARVRVDGAGRIVTAATPSGLGPTDLRSAYALPTTGGSGATIAIVDAQDNPNAESDLAVYRSTYGLPACTTTNGCFKKVNQSGQASPLPAADSGWAGEIALDLDMASAVCPSCKILLVEATSASMDDLGAAVNTAVALGATVVSNSYGGAEDSTITQADTAYFNHPGVLITASTGDDGYGVSYPASSPFVLAVGGTSLVKSTSAARGWTEGIWSGAGSGCSAYEAKPSWQHDTGCAKRTVGDVSAVADPNTGVAVYLTYGATGWQVYGGTSASSPIVAAVFALTGKASSGPGFPYANTADFYDITSGSNGSCTPSYLCKGTAGYDGPSGLGTPNATAIASGTAASDFSVAIAPASLSVQQGTAGTLTVTTAVTSGSAQAVTLSASGLPSGVTGSFSPASITGAGTSTLTLTASGSAALGTASITVTGTAASGSHAATASLTVTAPAGSPDFAVAVTPSSGTAAAGSSTTFNVATTAINGSAQSIALSVAGLPSGVTGSFSPASTTAGGGSTLTLTAASSAAAATATFTVTGTSGATNHSATASLTVTAAAPGVTTLSNGVAATGLSGALNAQSFFVLTVPAGQATLTFSLSGGTGDADMYVRNGAKPTLTTYDCRPYIAGNGETCTFTSPAAGDWYVMLNGYAAYSGVSLKGTYAADTTATLTNGVAVTGISGAKGSQQFWKLTVPAGQAKVVFTLAPGSGSTGDADLYVRSGSKPTTSTYTCRSWVVGNTENCTITNPAAGDYYVLINGYAAYTAVTLKGQYP